MPDLTNAYKIIEEFEGLVLHAYPDPISGGVPWTIGYGETKGVYKGMVITQEQALTFLKADVQSLLSKIQLFLKAPVTDNQLCSLISFAYNLGIGALHGSTLLSELNRGADRVTVSEQFLQWDHAGGRVIPGLLARRKAEARLFLT